MNISEFLGHKILCFHRIDQPLVSEMQKAIRFQHEQSMETGKRLWHVLARIRDDSRVCNLMGPGTESYERLTDVYATLTGQNVDDVREKVCPGSAALHRSEEEPA